MIRRIRALAPIAVAATTLAVPAGAGAQTAVLDPAETIRVVERADRWSGGVSREVVDDVRPAEVLLVQVSLEEAGYRVGAFTARLDEATRGALRRFQIRRGLTICGCVSYETIVALGIVPRVVDARYASRDVHRHPVIVVPGDRRRTDRRHDAGVVVGASGNPGVYVGHRPARGSGSDRHADRRPSRPDPDRGIGRRTPTRPRAGGPIRSGDRGGSNDRPSRPTPR